MFKQNFRIMTTLVGVVLWHAGAMQAQDVPHYVKVTVPFEFTVGNKLLPAGEYKFACTPREIELRDANGHVVASAVHHTVQAADALVPPKLVFTTTGGGHALRQIWPGTTTYGYELSPSNTAIALAKQRSNPPSQIGGSGNK